MVVVRHPLGVRVVALGRVHVDQLEALVHNMRSYILEFRHRQLIQIVLIDHQPVEDIVFFTRQLSTNCNTIGGYVLAARVHDLL